MGHSRSEIFDKYYVSQIVGADIQSVYLGILSKDAIIRLAGHMSLTRDPRVLTAIGQSRLSYIELEPEVKALKAKRDHLKADIIARFGMIKLARDQDTDLYEDYQATLADLRNRKKQVDREKFSFDWQTYFANVGCEEIDRQRRGLEPTYVNEQPSFAIEERVYLATLLCRNENVEETSEDVFQARRIQALQYMVSLCSRREAPRQTRQSSEMEIDQSTTTIEMEDLGDEDDEEDEERETLKRKDMICQGLQCPWCFHTQSLPIDTRTFGFANKYTLCRHITAQHLKFRNSNIQCPYQSCKAKIETKIHLKNHIEKDHKLSLPWK